MEKFWEWMAEKKYGFEFTDSLNDKHFIIKQYPGCIDPNKKMLVGYMIEYLTTHKKNISHIESYCMLKNGTMSIPIFIKHLEDDIKRFGEYGH